MQLKSGRVFYASAGGRFVIQDCLYQIEDDKPINLTEEIESQAIVKAINGAPASGTVVYSAKG